MSYHHNEHSHIERMHDHVDHCCGCIPVNTGAHLLGILALIGTFTAGANAYKWMTTLFLSPINTYSVYYLILTLFTAYAAVRYLLMLNHKTPHAKEQFANAYKCYTVFLRVMIIIGAVILEIMLVYIIAVLG